MQKNVVFWGIRKCVKIIIWTNKNSEFFVILITQKFHCVGWVNPVWGYILAFFIIRGAKRPRGTPRPRNHLSVRDYLSVREVPPGKRGAP